MTPLHLADKAKQGAAIIFISSDLEEILQYSDRVLVFFSGKVSMPIDAANPVPPSYPRRAGMDQVPDHVAPDQICSAMITFGPEFLAAPHEFMADLHDKYPPIWYDVSPMGNAWNAIKQEDALFILRHPEMPAVAFKDLWDTIRQGKKWTGYVKNLRKDGAYYWVFASVVPNIRNGRIVGYTSVRRKPSRTKVDECTALYKTLV